MKKEQRLLRIGVLGCGPIGQIAHFEACRKARNAELYAICDVAPDLLSRMGAIHAPRKSYSSYDDMLADEAVEAVIIGAADQFHVELSLKAVAAGKHVLVEKPLGVTIEECETLKAALAGKNIVLQIGNNRRFDPGISFGQRFVRRELGELLGFKGWYCDSTYRYTMTDNLQPLIEPSALARRPDGQPKSDKRRYYLLTHGSHLADTTRFLAGPIVSARARFLEKCGAFSWFVELELANQALAHLDLTIPIRGDFEEGFQIYGEHGSVKGQTFLPWFHKSSQVECFSTRDGQFHRPLGEDGHTYKRQLEGFADTILSGTPQHGANIEDGLAAMRLLVAIARSSENGQWARLDAMTGGV